LLSGLIAFSSDAVGLVAAKLTLSLFSRLVAFSSAGLRPLAIILGDTLFAKDSLQSLILGAKGLYLSFHSLEVHCNLPELSCHATKLLGQSAWALSVGLVGTDKRSSVALGPAINVSDGAFWTDKGASVSFGATVNVAEWAFGAPVLKKGLHLGPVEIGLAAAVDFNAALDSDAALDDSLACGPFVIGQVRPIALSCANVAVFVAVLGPEYGCEQQCRKSGRGENLMQRFHNSSPVSSDLQNTRPHQMSGV